MGLKGGAYDDTYMIYSSTSGTMVGRLTYHSTSAGSTANTAAAESIAFRAAAAT